MRSLSDSLQLERLESLQIFNTTVHESDLTKLIKMHAKALQVINLANVCLLTGNWLILLSALKHVDELETLRLSSIEGVGSPVQFRQHEKQRRKVTLDCGRSGQNMDSMLDGLVAGCNFGDSVAATYMLSSIS